MRAQYSGRLIYVHGISPVGALIWRSATPAGSRFPRRRRRCSSPTLAVMSTTSISSCASSSSRKPVRQ
ncbi:hypothetical protein [Lysobacter gummosus]|uniref:hypothetical protein n=1 Tax=Lysobacter gummosus TaxID=262324 RepID=UPI003630D6CB